MAEGGTGSEPRRDDLVRDPLTDFECALKLPTRAECERGMSMMLGWVPFTESGMVNTAFAALVAARNPSLTRQQYFSLVQGPNGRRVEPPFADDVRVGSGHDERARCSCGDGSAEEDRGAVLRCPVHGIGSQEVGSGHDEQTDTVSHQYFLRVIDALVAERDAARERAVAAVVDFLYEHEHNGGGSFYGSEWAAILRERFGSSVSGGE